MHFQNTNTPISDAARFFRERKEKLTKNMEFLKDSKPARSTWKSNKKSKDSWSK